MALFCVVVPGLRTLTESAEALTRPFSCAESLTRFTFQPFPLLGHLQNFFFSWLTILIKFIGTFYLK